MGEVDQECLDYSTEDASAELTSAMNYEKYVYYIDKLAEAQRLYATGWGWFFEEVQPCIEDSKPEDAVVPGSDTYSAAKAPDMKEEVQEAAYKTKVELFNCLQADEDSTVCKQTKLPALKLARSRLSYRLLAECYREAEKLEFEWANPELAELPLLRLTDQRLILSSMKAGGLHLMPGGIAGVDEAYEYKTERDGKKYVLVLHGETLDAETKKCSGMFEHRNCRVRITGKWYRYLPTEANEYNVGSFAQRFTDDIGWAGCHGTCPRHPAPHSEDGRDLYNFAKYESSVYSAPDAHPSEMTLELDCSYFTGHKPGKRRENKYTKECKDNVDDLKIAIERIKHK